MEHLPNEILVEVCDFLTAQDLRSFLASSKKFWSLRYEEWFSKKIDPYLKIIDEKNWIFGLGEAMQHGNLSQTNFFMENFISECNELNVSGLCTKIKQLNQIENSDHKFMLNIWSFVVISAKNYGHDELMQYALGMSGGLYEWKLAPKDYYVSIYKGVDIENPLYFHYGMHWDAMKYAIKQCNLGWISWLLKMDEHAVAPLQEPDLYVKEVVIRHLAKAHVNQVRRADWEELAPYGTLLRYLLEARLFYFPSQFEQDHYCDEYCCGHGWLLDDYRFQCMDDRKMQRIKRDLDCLRTKQRTKHESFKTYNLKNNHKGRKGNNSGAWRKEERRILEGEDM